MVCCNVFNLVLNIRDYRDFLSGSVVKTSPSSSEVAGLISGLGAKSPHASGPKKKQKTKTQNRRNVVTNSIKMF